MNSLMKAAACISTFFCLITFLIPGCSEKSASQDKEKSVTKTVSELAELPAVSQTKTDHSASLQAVLLPENPTVMDILTVEIKTGRGVGIPPVTIRWYVNENIVQGEGNNLDLSPFMPGDDVYAEVIFDGDAYEPVMTETMIVANAPPEVIQAAGEIVTASGRHIFRVNADVTDPDRDRVTVTFRFYVNGTLFSDDKSGDLDISNLKRGDKVTCVILARDERGGEGEKSIPTYTVNNRPPTIVSRPPRSIAGDVFRYKIASQDPDGDELVYELLEGPEGMVLLEDTLHWDVRSADTSGTFRAVVKATDGNGGNATQEFSLSVSSK